MDRAIAGEIEDLQEEFDNEVEAWHSYAETIPEDVIGENLHLWLGMTWKEYADYVSLSLGLEDIVNNRLN